jgi:hypothetical protein
MIAYYRGRWPEAEVPEGEPLWLYYEVDTEKDVVLRTVEVYPDGRIERNSIALEERNGASCPSLVDGPFMVLVQRVPLEEIKRDVFEVLWVRGRDKPVWFVD